MVYYTHGAKQKNKLKDTKVGRHANYLLGYLIVSGALLLGLLLNVSANIISDMIKDNAIANSLILIINFISVLGGKFTIHRLMAEHAVDAVCDNKGVQKPCQTATTPL